MNLTRTIDKERRITEKYELDIKVDNLNMVMDFEDEHLIEKNYENLKKFIEKEEEKLDDVPNGDISKEDNTNKINIIDNNHSNCSSIDMEVDNLEKAYSFSALPSNIEPESSEKKNQNQSMFESFKRKEKPKKPPIPAPYNLYKTADKNFLNKIQKILKNKESKKLTYASSEGEESN